LQSTISDCGEAAASMRRMRPESLRLNVLKPADKVSWEQLLAFERGAVLTASVAKLPLIHREVLSLRFEEDMKLEEIAEVAGIPISTVKSRLGRALESLRVRLEWK
jgi:RNA polymerase sigma factor (sigma-70 family)